MTPYVPTPEPTPIPEWMKECNLAYFSSSSPNPISVAYCAPGGSTSEIRYQWYPKEEGQTNYSPNGQKVSQWMANSPRVSFAGKYAEKKVISISAGAPTMAKVWIRFWDENGFMWDSPTLDVGSV